ncbi:hypothetical protein BKG85_04815 [Mycobacteroides chelonae]|nr:hypothetical protein BKG85_04815 [Mycobacteroides chelonae]
MTASTAPAKSGVTLQQLGDDLLPDRRRRPLNPARQAHHRFTEDTSVSAVTQRVRFTRAEW